MCKIYLKKYRYLYVDVNQDQEEKIQKIYGTFLNSKNI